MILFHDPRCVDYSRPGHPERPQRISATVPFLKASHPDWSWREPQVATREMLLRAHSAQHIDAIENATHDFDADSPAYPNIFAHAARASGAAVDVAQAAMRGEKSFSLMRPPGHHATRDQAMGFCYFSHIAVAALDALAHGAERVAIWDFDAHHGNGTEAIVADHAQIAFASIHQSPGYPGTGVRSFANIHNFPLRPVAPRAQHMEEIERALHSLGEFKPDLLLVSAGFDAYAGDPITEMTVEMEDFATCGKWLRESGIPAGAILEGGYSDDLPELIDAFLTAWAED
jgi:acetoin utilization deacetylase AcuC-like enzyme